MITDILAKLKIYNEVEEQKSELKRSQIKKVKKKIEDNINRT